MKLLCVIPQRGAVFELGVRLVHSRSRGEKSKTPPLLLHQHAESHTARNRGVHHSAAQEPGSQDYNRVSVKSMDLL